MLQRPYFSGFRLAKMQSLLNCRDEAVLAQVLDTLERKVPGDRPDLDDAHEIVRRAVMGGVPFDDLTLEELPHVYAAQALAQTGQTHLFTRSEELREVGFIDAWDMICEVMDRRSQPFLEHLMDGRPLFGRRMDDVWGSYAWLSLDEMLVLEQALRQAPKSHLDHPSRFVVAELLKWLHQIMEEDMDLWYVAR